MSEQPTYWQQTKDVTRFAFWLLFRAIPGGAVLLIGMALTLIGEAWCGDE